MRGGETGGFFGVIDPENVECAHSLSLFFKLFFISVAALHQTRKVQIADS